MAQFLHGNTLNAEIENIFRYATGQLILISPFIKLHERYKSSLLTHREDDKLEIIVVFGKNEDNLTKSMSMDDLNFLKQFPDVEIRHEKRLHAKYYANESTAIITSMNLYSFSQDNNIEVGVLIEHKNFGNNSLDNDAYDYFNNEVIQQSELIFKKSPQYENTLLGLRKNYTKSIIEVDRISELFSEKQEKNNVVIKNENQKPTGFCIRTGTKIPFNIKMPLSQDAYKSWNKFGDKTYPEKFCHFSGESSNQQTSFEKPILQKNWKKAKEVFGF